MRRSGRVMLGVLLAAGGALVGRALSRTPRATVDDDATGARSTNSPSAAATLSARPRSLRCPRQEASGASPATATDAATIAGRVVDESGRSVDGARVVTVRYMYLRWTYGGGAIPVAAEMCGASAATGPDGAFAFDAQTRAECVRVEEGPGWSRSLSMPAGPDVTLRVAREPRLAGVVLDPDGAPAGGVPVVAACRDEEGRAFEIAVTSGADGRFSARLPPEIAKTDVRWGSFEGTRPPPGALGGQVPGLLVPRSDLIVRLVAGVFLRGQVLDASGGPAAVSLTALSSPLDFPTQQRIDVAASAEGRFEIGPVRPGRWTLVARPVGPVSTYTESCETAPAAEILLRLAAASSLIGEVVGEDIAGFEVLWTLPDGPEGVRRGTVRVGERGEFRIDGLPRAPVSLYARRIGDERYALDSGANPGGSAPWRLVLVRGEKIEGRADGYEGRVIAHQGPLQHEGRASGGSFRIAGLPPGKWTLRKVARSQSGNYACEGETGTPTETDAGATEVALK